MTYSKQVCLAKIMYHKQRIKETQGMTDITNINVQQLQLWQQRLEECKP